MVRRRAHRQKNLGAPRHARPNQSREETRQLRPREEEPPLRRPRNLGRLRADPRVVRYEGLEPLAVRELVAGLALAGVAELDEGREGFDFALGGDFALPQALQLGLEAA